MQLPGILTRNLPFQPRIDQPQARNPLQDGQGDVGGDTEVHDQSVQVTILWDVGDAEIHRLPWRADTHLFALEPDLSALRPVSAKEHPRDLCASGPHQARETQDLA